MIYELIFTAKAEKDIVYLKRTDQQAYKKLEKLLKELQEHPSTGTGKPELLRYVKGLWSRRITHRHRLVYYIRSTEIVVDIISASGHYSDK